MTAPVVAWLELMVVAAVPELAAVVLTIASITFRFSGGSGNN